MAISGSHARLKKAMTELMVHWHNLRGSWRDAKADEFEKTVLDPLQAQVRKVQTAMEQIDSILNSAQHDCE